MCDKLSELRGAVCRYAARFDPALVTGAQARAAMLEASAIERAAGALKALAATRVAETSSWRGGGARSAAEFLARESGSSVPAAADAIRTAERLKSLPQASAAARRGELSAEQASAVASGARANPGAEGELVAQAKKGSLQELRLAAARARATAEGDGAEARRRRIHARRSLKDWTDVEGMWHLSAQDNPEVGAQIMAAVNAERDRIFRQAREEGRREPYEAYGIDALAAIADAYLAAAFDDDQDANDANDDDADVAAGCGADAAGAPTAPTDGPRGGGPRRERTGGPGADGSEAPTAMTSAHAPATTSAEAPPATAAGAPTRRRALTPRRGATTEILVRIDLGAMLRGFPIDGEVCEIAGYGPVAVSAVREMLATGNAFLSAIVTDGVRVTGVAHLRRTPNVYEKTALRWRYPTCAAEGCSATARLENDHRDDWAKTHITAFDGLDRLCGTHHDLKTRENWALTEGVGKRPFVPPTDPRHPRHAGSASTERPPPAANDPPEAA